MVVAATLWGDNWQGKLVCFHSDNEAVVSVLNKGHAQDIALTHLMRCLAFFLHACAARMDCFGAPVIYLYMFVRT